MNKEIPKIINTENKSKIGSYLLLLGTLTVMFGVAEILFRYVGSPIREIESIYVSYQFNINYGIEPKPNLKYMEYGEQVSTNKNAMFGPETPIHKNGVRVAYLGDSYTVGPGIAFEKNYPFLVTQALKTHFHEDVDMVIGGIAGSSPFQQKFIFEKKILPYSPDIIICEMYFNDISDDFIFRYSSYFARMNIYANTPKFLLKSKFIQQFVVVLMEQLTRFYKYKYDHAKNILNEKPEEVWEKLTKPALDRMLQLANDHEAKFFLVLIPYQDDFANERKSNAPAQKRTFLSNVTFQWAKENQVP